MTSKKSLTNLSNPLVSWSRIPFSLLLFVSPTSQNVDMTMSTFVLNPS